MVNVAKSPVASLALFCSLILLVGSEAIAQETPDWNRRVLSFELMPPSPDEPSWSSRAVLSITGFTANADGADGSLLAQFLVNGAVVGEQLMAVVVPTPGNCNCTSGCDYPGGWCDNSEFGCWCGVTVTTNPNYYTNRSLSPGDVVSVRIVAAPGSVEEQHTADDEASILVEEPVSTAPMGWSSLKGLYR